MENEIWKPIKDYEGLYEVSNLGRVKSLERKVAHPIVKEKTIKEKLLKYNTDKNGYLYVTLYKDGKSKSLKIHRLVAIAFISNPDNKPDIDHINTNKADNRVDNLRWVTKEENMNNPLTKEKQKINTSGERHYKYGKRGSECKDSIRVVQLTLNGELVKIWDSIRMVNDYGFQDGSACRCCKGKFKQHKGFKWMYYADYIKLNKEVE